MTRWCLVSRKNLVSTCIEIYVLTLQPDNQTVPPRWVTFFVLLFSTMQCILFRFLGWRLLVSGITSLTGTTNWLYIRDDQPPVTVVSVGGTIIAGSTSGIFSAVYTSYTHYTDQTDFTRSVVDNTYTATAMTTPTRLTTPPTLTTLRTPTAPTTSSVYPVLLQLLYHSYFT